MPIWLRRVLTGTAGVVTLLAVGASCAHAQEIVASTRKDFALIAAIVAVLLMPAAEAGIYRLALRARFWRGLWLCAVLDLAAYGLAVLWLNYLPGGVNPWFAWLVFGEQSGFSGVAAIVAVMLYGAAFAAVKVPALIWWLRHGGPDRGITITVLLANLVIFFAISDVVAVLASILS